jgi:tetratricopeptide (TPR) repeat protein
MTKNTYQTITSVCLVWCFVTVTTEPARPAFAQSAPVQSKVSWQTAFSKGQQALTDQKLDLSETNFRQALQLAKSGSQSSSDIETCMRKLADVLSLRDKTAEAQQVYANLLQIVTRRYGAGSTKLAPILIALGSIQEAAGDHTTAMRYYQQALTINEKQYGPYSPAVGANLHSLARAAYATGNKADGEKHYQRAIAILSKDPSLEASKELQDLMQEHSDLIKHSDDSDRQLINDFKKDIIDQPPTNPSAAPASAPKSQTGGSSWQQQSDFQLHTSRESQSDEDTKIALRGMSQPLSDKSLDPAYRVMNNTIFGENHYEKSQSYYERMIAIDVNALGPHHPSVANDLTGLAQLYIKQKRYSDAAPLLERALSIYDQVYGANNLLSINTCTTLASAEFQRGNAEIAAGLYRRALSQRQSILNPNSLETARILNDLAYLYFHQGKLQDAVTFYDWALASTEGAVGKEDPLTAACLKDYAQVLRSMGRINDAQNYDTRAEQILATAGPTRLPRQEAYSDK